MNEESHFLHHTNCEACGSSDANAIYSNATSYCFSCQAWDRLDEVEEPEEVFERIPDLDEVTANAVIGGLRDRKIKRGVAEFFGLLVEKDEDEQVTQHYYPYTKGGEVVAYKQRTVDGKVFRSHGDMKKAELFGQSLFKQGGRKLIITEGEIDAMAVAQANLDSSGVIHPVVSLPNGAGSVKAVLHNLDWVRSFGEVILMFDQDEPGIKATDEVAKIIGADKVKIAKLKHKDASESYLAVGDADIQHQIWNAQPWCPAGIINGVDTWDQYVEDREAVYVPYPEFCPQLNKKIHGRRFGSITMFTSGTGSGKTSFLREDMYHLFKTTDSKIGICSLEESIAETTRGIISLEMSKRVGIPGTETTIEEEREAWEKTMGSERFELLDHQGSLSDASLMDKLRYLAATCDFIYLDHITIAVSEAEGDINKAIDAFMSDLLKICKQHNCWFGVVSHLRKTGVNQESFEEGGDISEDDLKGSGSLKQISAQIIALTRNKHADDPTERHTVKIKVLKDRFGGDTGWAGGYRFNMKTGRLYHGMPPEIPFNKIEEND